MLKCRRWIRAGTGFRWSVATSTTANSTLRSLVSSSDSGGAGAGAGAGAGSSWAGLGWGVANDGADIGGEVVMDEWPCHGCSGFQVQGHGSGFGWRHVPRLRLRRRFLLQ